MSDASILVLTKNGADSIRNLLQAVFSQREAGLREVIVIDSGSSDATLQIASEFPVHIERIPPESFHHARTRNLAASLASGEVVVFLSQDAVPASDDWLQAMLANFADPKVGAVYGRQIPRTDSSVERQDVLDTIYGEQRIVKDPSAGNQIGYRYYHFSDVNAALRRTVWQSTPYPEELKVFEDLAIAKVILDAGWKIVYEPRACVFHSHRHSTLALFKRYFDIGYTLRYLKIWNSPGTGSSMFRDAGKLFRNKLHRARLQGTRSSAGSFAQDLAKSVGLFLGLNQGCIPLALKRHLSAHGIYETKEVD
jgi:glycosyltransferase involved in cell wall biosynthesis